MKKTALNLKIDDHALNDDNPIAHFKDLINANTDQLAAELQSGTSIADLLRARAVFIDSILLATWKKFLCADINHFSLIAIGGYGRQELQPYSDVDILILYDSEITDEHKTKLEKFLQFLWDIGLKLGNSLRTLAECVDSAREDQVITTALIESRLLYGSEALFQKMKTGTEPASIWPIEQYFEVKLQEQQERYKKFNNTAFNLEPNVKEDPGGLRDIHMIAWIKKRHYNSDSLQDLVLRGCLTQAEFEELTQAYDFLNTVRFALHCLARSPENRLAFDHQRVLAKQFGFEKTEQSSAVEKFMQKYYRTVMAVERLSEMLLQLFREIIYREHEKCTIEPISPQFQSVCGFIEVTDDTVFQQRPESLLEIFLTLQQMPGLKGIRASTIRLIREHLHLVNDTFRSNSRNKKLFIEILSQNSGIVHQLRRMNRYGFLAAYLPAFSQIVGRLQYDLFHVYTVDEHTLILIRNLRRFALAKHKNELPFCNDVFLLIRKPSLLYIAGLFHDIAKGKGGDHSVLGESIAEEFCLAHHLTQQESELVSWLVRNHLVMSMTAQRKDLSDPVVIYEFASLVGNLERLNYLYLLTVADMRATNPKIWNSWKDSLLKELYNATLRTLHQGLKDPSDQRLLPKSSKNEALSILCRLGLAPTTINATWENLNEDYFQRYSVDETVWHTIAIAATQPNDLPLVLLRPQNQRSSLEILLYTHDQDQLFSNSTGILDQLCLTILDARIITTRNGLVINSYLVLEQSGEPIRDLFREQQICKTLRSRMLSQDPGKLSTIRRVHNQVKHFPIQPRVSFEIDRRQNYTLMELTAADQPGLLSKVGQVFNHMNIRVHQAKITTVGNRAEDVFFITDWKNQPISSEKILKEISEQVIEIVSG